MMNKKLFVILIVLLACEAALCCMPSITTASGFGYEVPQNFCSGRLIFEDNFDHLNLQHWKHEVTMSGCGNSEFEWYVNDRKNSFVSNGNLHLRPTLTSEIYGEDFLRKGHVKIPPNECTMSGNWGCERQGTPDHIINPVRSARITTYNSFAFKYGTMEVRAKMPGGDWLWPAIWLLPKNSVYGMWPRSGEIDLLEARGNRKLYAGNTHVGTEQGGSTMHFGPRWDHNGWPTAHATKNHNPGYDSAFHNYKLVWTPTQIQFFYDNQHVLTVNADQGFWKRGHFEHSGLPNPWIHGTPMAPFDQEFFIILNNAVGGTNYFSDSFRNEPNPKPWKNNSPKAMTDFWNGRNQWLPTWYLKTRDWADMQVDFVRVWAL